MSSSEYLIDAVVQQLIEGKMINLILFQTDVPQGVLSNELSDLLLVYIQRFPHIEDRLLCSLLVLIL